MLLFKVARKFQLINLKYDANAKIMEITRKISNLSKYAINISDSKISMYEMGNVPSSLFGRQSIFQMYAHNRSCQIAGAQLAAMAPMMAMQMQNADPQYATLYQQQMYMNLYKEARKEAAEQEKKLLNEQEKELVQEKTKYESLVAQYDAELNALKQSDSKDLEFFKPNVA